MDEKNGRAKYAAFMPSKKTKNISVYRITSCKEKRIWLLGDVFVAPIRKLPVLARADFSTDQALDLELSVVSDPHPHPRHAVVANWPEVKAFQRIKAMALSQGATLLLHPRTHIRKV